MAADRSYCPDCVVSMMEVRISYPSVMVITLDRIPVSGEKIQFENKRNSIEYKDRKDVDDMCGIAGMIGLSSDERIRERMIRTMKRRGPDADGIYTDRDRTLLHARLAIIDPEGGNQPMKLSWAGREYVMVYNGELYNTREVRILLEKLGHRFLGYSDTEVALHAYAHWNEACLEKLNGIFAFGVLEEISGEFFMARDRIGVKPLFYTEHNGGLIFSSEIKTILSYPGVRAILDRSGASEILLLGPGRTPGSGIFRGIRELEPGCCGWYVNGKLNIHRYWRLRDREHTESFAETAEYVRFLVEDAIQRQTVSDMPLGTFLSGGLDSSLITAICARQAGEPGKILHPFSVDYENNEQYFVPGKFQPNSDNHYIRLMERFLNTNHHWTVLTPDVLEESLNEAVVARDLPGMADVDGSLLAFCKEIRKHVKVALSGECADEIFGGYPWYRDPEIRESEGFPWSQNMAQRMAMLSPMLREAVSPEQYIRERYEQTCRESDILPGCDPLERRMKEMMNLNFRWFMQTLLDRKDRMSMYSGLEVRVPFCDYRIAEYLYGVPWAFKDYMGVEKGLLRKAMEGLLPEEVLWRKKSPYPKTFDPRYRERMVIRLKELISDSEAPIWQIADRDEAALLLISEHIWPWYGQLMKGPQTMAYLLQIDFWLRKYSVDISY